MKQTLRRSPAAFLAAALATSLLAPSIASAQSVELKSPYDPVAARAVEGRVVVKLTRDAAGLGTAAAGMLASARPDLGIFRSSAWIRPSLTATPAQLHRRNGAARVDDGLSRLVVVEYSSLASPAAVASALGSVAGVEYAEPVYPRRLLYSPNDPGTSQQWYLDVIGARNAWDDVRADSTIVVAVVDAGIDPQHEDLSAALWRNAGEMGIVEGVDRRTNGVDDDANGYVDDWQGWDFSGADGRTPDNLPDPARESHGTEMAGIIGATGDNGRGIAGVAYGVRLMSLKITDEPTSGFESPGLFNTHEAILYAAKMGADVINCSWGDQGRMRSEQEVIDAATGTYGAVVIASAGNSGNENLFYPASYRGVLSVGAVENGDTKAGFSNFGYRVDISAPGTHIYASSLSNQYVYGQGTSHAAAVVSGAAALVRRKFPQLDAEQVAEMLRATADDNGPLLGDYAGKLGSGRVNVFNAMLDGATMSSARMTEYVVVDAGGDGIIDPGESVSISARVRNILAPVTSVSATLAAVSPLIAIEDAEVQIGAMATGESVMTPSGSFRFTVPANAAANSTITLKVSVRTAMRGNDAYIVLRVAPTFMTTDLNRIAATFNGSGNIGYHGTDRRLGDGFRAAGGKDLLYHGGLMIGTSADRLSDAVRVGPLGMGTAEGFRTIDPYRLETLSGGTLQRGAARFDDGHRGDSARVGVDVRLTTYESTAEADQDYVLAVYAITNTTAAPLSNLHAGLYLDWDVALLGDGDIAALDEPRRLGHVTNPNVPGLVAGAALVSAGQGLAFNAVDNGELEVSSSFTPQKKWQLLGNGIGTRTTPPADAGLVIGAGPLAIDPGATARVAFMLSASTSLEGLHANADRAVARYNELVSVGDERTPVGAGFLAVAAPSPTPGAAHLSFALSTPSAVIVRIVDATGRIVLVPYDGHLGAGDQRIAVDASGLDDGVYFFEIIAAGRIARGRIVKLDGVER